MYSPYEIPRRLFSIFQTVTQAISLMVLRNRLRERVKRAPAIANRARNWGQITARPAPRKRIAWPSETKWVVGAVSMMICTNPFGDCEPVNPLEEFTRFPV